MKTVSPFAIDDRHQATAKYRRVTGRRFETHMSFNVVYFYGLVMSLRRPRAVAVDAQLSDELAYNSRGALMPASALTTSNESNISKQFDAVAEGRSGARRTSRRLGAFVDAKALSA